jgi:hypothetical protein
VDIWSLGDLISPRWFGFEEASFQACGSILLGENCWEYVSPMCWPSRCHKYLSVVVFPQCHNALRLPGHPVVESLEGKWDSRRTVE